MSKRYISASAGSGKTYTITTEVAKLVENKTLEPEKVIMTTFTNAAADELREKTKKELSNLGLYDAAMRIDYALIGTVHSIANIFITKYWYLLGVSPDAMPLEESEMKLFREHSMLNLLDENERKFMYKACETYEFQDNNTHKPDYEFWKTDLISVLNYMQWYGIGEEELKGNSMALTQSIIDCLKPRCEIKLEDLLTEEFFQEVNEFLPEKQSKAKTDGKKDKQKEARDFYYSLRGITDVNKELIDEFFEHYKLDRKINGVKTSLGDIGQASKALAEFMADRLYFTAENATWLEQYAKIIFDIAVKWRKQYREYKDLHHLVDFNDMEEYFLYLLNMQEVQDDIKSNYTHLFVDEFQDSSPIQVKIFDTLSALLDETCFVGDKKQAIYGFRGADTELTAAVADGIDKKETLECSYRSIKPLVNFSNSVFAKIFNGKIAEEDITLNIPEKNGNIDNVEKPLRVWNWEKENAIAVGISRLINEEKILPKDIAVLARTKSEFDSLTKELKNLGIPVCREIGNIAESRTGRLMKSMLTLIVEPTNQKARAEIAYLTEKDQNITKIIEDRLDHLAKTNNGKEYLSSTPIIHRLMQLLGKEDENQETPNLLAYQSISSLIETLIIELDLYALVQCWEDPSGEEANLQAFIDLARQYEDSSVKLATPATVAGFLDYFCNQKQSCASDDNGVRLFSYHKSKGLEWKVVILLSLDNNSCDTVSIAKRSILGCHNYRESEPTAENLYPPMSISLVRDIYSDKKEAKEAIVSRLQGHRIWEQVYEKEKSESARLLYVGVTRARNILILAPKKGSFNWFSSLGIDNVLNLAKFDTEDVSAKGAIPTVQDNNQVHDILKGYSSIKNIRNISPSKVEPKSFEYNILNDKEQRIEVHISDEEEAGMGDFIHQVFCCMDDGISEDEIKRLRGSYGFTEKHMLHPEKLKDAWDYLIKMLTEKYGAAIKHHHEVPFRHKNSNGHLVSGFIDFVWETEDGYVVVDYKSYAGGFSQVFGTREHCVSRYGSQLKCYNDALNAQGGKKVKACLIFYPVTCLAAEVKCYIE
jgi:ATP-dependent exoDNAse (exonuclease V) beta subunit